MRLETRVIVFPKKGRKSTIDKSNFLVSNEHIEIVNNYTLHVGVKFSADGISYKSLKKLNRKNTGVLNLWWPSRSFC